MDSDGFLAPQTRQEWKNWLEKNHIVKREVWLIFFKNRTGMSGISYEDSVEEALCYGWIDSIVKRIDDSRFARKFTPRTDSRTWSESNVRRVKKLIHEGRMTRAGLAKIDESVLKRKTSHPPRRAKELAIPPEIRKVLVSHKGAWEYFSSLAPSYRRLYLGWILDAKREETRTKRLHETMEYLKQKRRLPLK